MWRGPKLLAMPECRPIGVIATPFADPTAPPRQGHLGDARGVLEIDPEFTPGLGGIEPGNTYLIVWFADRADRSILRLDRDERRGVFSSRSQDRPNPICLTRCLLDVRDGSTLTFRGVDMADETPVLDIKVPLSPP